VWEAPINLVVCANQERSARRYGDRGRTLYSVLDAAAAVENILLAAHSLGLGACWVGAFDAEKVSLALKLPKALRPVAIIPVGYPAEYPIPTPRMGLEEFVHIDFYGSSYRRR
jgi:nitroreductase